MDAFLAPKVIALTDGATVSLDAGLGNVFDWTLGAANHTLAAPANSIDGETITIRIKYSGTFTPLFNAVFDFSSTGQPVWTSTSGKTDEAAFTYCAAANTNVGKWRFKGAGLGYTS